MFFVVVDFVVGVDGVAVILGITFLVVLELFVQSHPFEKRKIRKVLLHAILDIHIQNCYVLYIADEKG